MGGGFFYDYSVSHNVWCLCLVFLLFFPSSPLTRLDCYFNVLWTRRLKGDRSECGRDGMSSVVCCINYLANLNVQNHKVVIIDFFCVVH